MVFAGCEDFGIALAEAQACGTPLIAFGRGGAADIVRPLGRDRRSRRACSSPGRRSRRSSDAVERFEANRAAITPAACRENAERFSDERFDAAILAAAATVDAMHGISPEARTRLPSLR